MQIVTELCIQSHQVDCAVVHPQTAAPQRSGWNAWLRHNYRCDGEFHAGPGPPDDQHPEHKCDSARHERGLIGEDEEVIQTMHAHTTHNVYPTKRKFVKARVTYLRAEDRYSKSQDHQRQQHVKRLH